VGWLSSAPDVIKGLEEWKTYTVVVRRIRVGATDFISSDVTCVNYTVLEESFLDWKTNVAGTTSVSVISERDKTALASSLIADNCRI